MSHQGPTRVMLAEGPMSGRNLLVGLPVALAVRGTVEAFSWLLALIVG